jgi:hypothetical protein
MNTHPKATGLSLAAAGMLMIAASHWPAGDCDVVLFHRGAHLSVSVDHDN